MSNELDKFKVKLNHFQTYEDLTQHYYNQFIALSEHRENCNDDFGYMVEQTINDRYKRDKRIFYKDERLAMKQYYAEKRYLLKKEQLQYKHLVKEEKQQMKKTTSCWIIHRKNKKEKKSES